MSETGRQDDERNILSEIRDKITKLAAEMEKVQIADYIQLLNSPRKLIVANFIAGISRGVGIAIGVTIFAAGILYLLRMLGALNLPIIGDFIAELIKIVQAQLEGRRAY